MISKKKRRKILRRLQNARLIASGSTIALFGILFTAAYRASNELKKQGILVSGGGVRSIWQRHNLETFKKRLRALEEKAAKEGIVYTEEQLRVLEITRREREESPDEIETEHPGYLLAQDTYYVGYLKGVGRIKKKSDWPAYRASIMRVLSPNGFYVLSVFSPKFPLFRGSRRPWHIAQGAYRRYFARGDILELFGRYFEVLEMIEENGGQHGFWHVLFRRRT